MSAGAPAGASRRGAEGETRAASVDWPKARFADKKSLMIVGVFEKLTISSNLLKLVRIMEEKR